MCGQHTTPTHSSTHGSPSSQPALLVQFAPWVSSNRRLNAMTKSVGGREGGGGDGGGGDAIDRDGGDGADAEHRGRLPPPKLLPHTAAQLAAEARRREKDRAVHRLLGQIFDSPCTGLNELEREREAARREEALSRRRQAAAKVSTAKARPGLVGYPLVPSWDLSDDEAMRVPAVVAEPPPPPAASKQSRRRRVRSLLDETQQAAADGRAIGHDLAEIGIHARSVGMEARERLVQHQQLQLPLITGASAEVPLLGASRSAPELALASRTQGRGSCGGSKRSAVTGGPTAAPAGQHRVSALHRHGRLSRQVRVMMDELYADDADA